MVICLRLSRLGCRNKPFYKVMDADSRFPRDGKHLEVLGYTIPSCGRVVVEEFGIGFILRQNRRKSGKDSSEFGYRVVVEESGIGFISRQNRRKSGKIKLNKHLPYLFQVADITKKEVYLLFGTFVVIAASQLQLNISCVLEHLISGPTTFLRKAIQALIMTTLETLNALNVANGEKLGSAAYGVIIEELSTVMRHCKAFFVVLIPFADTSFDDLLGLLISITIF
ncbi:hypothetical protein OROHE_012539 [Orobanche hederae]